jgi:hypothetical protein
MSADRAAAGGGMKKADLAFFGTLLGIFIFGTIFAFRPEDGHATLWDGKTAGILVATGMTLALYSFLYGDNPLFKAAEHLYIGVGLAYQIVIVWFEYIKPEAYKQFIRYFVRDVPGKPDWWLAPALVLSALMLARLIPAVAYLSRIPVAFIVGFTAGTQVPNFISANVLQQVYGTIGPMLTLDGIGAWIGQIVIIAGVVSVLMYFFFSVEHRGAFGVGSRLGVWFLMVAFGASFGYTVMGRMALLVGRLQFLIGDWLNIPLG